MAVSNEQDLYSMAVSNEQETRLQSGFTHGVK